MGFVLIMKHTLKQVRCYMIHKQGYFCRHNVILLSFCSETEFTMKLNSFKLINATRIIIYIYIFTMNLLYALAQIQNPMELYQGTIHLI